jgi:hypothetical protein
LQRRRQCKGNDEARDKERERETETTLNNRKNTDEEVMRCDARCRLMFIRSEEEKRGRGENGERERDK